MCGVKSISLSTGFRWHVLPGAKYQLFDRSQQMMMTWFYQKPSIECLALYVQIVPHFDMNVTTKCVANHGKITGS